VRRLNVLVLLFVLGGCTCLNRKIDSFQKNFSGPPTGAPKGEPAELAPRVGKRP